MIKIQIKGYEDLVIFADTVEEAVEFIQRFQTEDGPLDLRGMSAPDAAVTLLRTNGKAMTSAQIAYELISSGVRSQSEYSRKNLTQNIRELYTLLPCGS